MKFRQRRHYEPPEINFIPLIDVLLVILIFLMVTTTYSRFSQLDITLPAAKAATAETDGQKIEPVLVAISEQGELMVNNSKIASQEPKVLADALEAATRGQNKAKAVIVINADAKATHQSVIRVMEIARNSGFSQLTFAIQNKQ